jgi:hypothetical protein
MLRNDIKGFEESQVYMGQLVRIREYILVHIVREPLKPLYRCSARILPDFSGLVPVIF